MRPLISILTVLLLSACRSDHQLTFRLVEWPLPDSRDGGEPNLFVSDAGGVYLSWVAYENDTTDVLLFSQMAEDGWTEPRQIAAGSNWFVNWADFPSLAVYPGDGKNMAAHWLAMSAEGTYDYDIWIAQSADGGESWGLPFRPHTDGVQAEHGFVSLQPLAADRMLAVWLDGRHTKSGQEEPVGHEHGHGGAMTLRTATFDPQGNLYDEAELDARVCDCCQTGVALAEQGPVVVYRDRSKEEIRDIFLTRWVAGSWTEPKSVFQDNWKIAGCPVNGPAIGAEGNRVVVAWFTAANEEPQVKVTFSNDGGESFGAPFRLDGGLPLGRVDLAILNQDEVLVSWLENPETGAEVRVAKVSPQGIIDAPLTLLATDAGRQSGFPRIVYTGEHLMLAWTAMDSTTTKVKTGRIDF